MDAKNYVGWTVASSDRAWVKELLQGRFQTQGMGAETDLDCTQEAKNGNTQRGGRLDPEAAG